MRENNKRGSSKTTVFYLPSAPRAERVLPSFPLTHTRVSYLQYFFSIILDRRTTTRRPQSRSKPRHDITTRSNNIATFPVLLTRDGFRDTNMSFALRMCPHVVYTTVRYRKCFSKLCDDHRRLAQPQSENSREFS